jgi:uncharacterized protein
VPVRVFWNWQFWICSGWKTSIWPNALKVILTTAFNTLAVVIFLAVGKIYWMAGLIVGTATIVGGYSGAWIAQRLPQAWVRGFVIIVGAAMTIYFFLRIK